MAPQTWTVLIVAAAFLLLGVASSPLAWVALLHKRARFQQEMERRLAELAGRLRVLEARLAASSGLTKRPAEDEVAPLETSSWRWPARFRTDAPRGVRRETTDAASPSAIPTLIAVPTLAPPPSEREAFVSSLTKRYSEIWTLADTGASPDVIAKATGQPVAQIELILGLRRRIEATGTTTPHAEHV